ncbi:MAG: hypothetical protein HYZ75_12225 [Elusimicrobia bacterium]|nr:hypothetical protein [Elusimicrobiota bacterium]
MAPAAPLWLFLAAAWAAETAEPVPFDVEEYEARIGRRAYEQTVLPLLTRSPTLESGLPRFVIGEGDLAGAFLDRAVTPHRPLSVDEVELLVELREAGNKPQAARDLVRLREAAALARRRPGLFGGKQQAEAAAAYLEATAAGRFDVVPPAGRLKLARPPEAPPPAPPPSDRRQAGRGFTLSEPALPLSPDGLVLPPPAAPPPAADKAAPPPPGISDRIAQAFRSATKAAASSIQDVNRTALRIAGHQPPAASKDIETEALLAQAAKAGPDVLARLFTRLSDPSLAETPETREVLLAGLARLEAEAKGKNAGDWGPSMAGLVRALSQQGALDSAAAVRIADAARGISAGEPVVVVLHLSNAWALLAEAAKLDEKAAKRVEQARSAMVERAFAAELEALSRADGKRRLSPWLFAGPMFSGDPRVVGFGKSLIAAAPESAAGPATRAVMVRDGLSILTARSAFEPEWGVRAMEALAVLAEESKGDRYIGNTIEAVNAEMAARLPRVWVLHFGGPEKTAGASGAAPKEELRPPTEPALARQERLDAARERIVRAYLPGVLEDFKDPAKRESALGEATRPLMMGSPIVFQALLEEVAASKPGPAERAGTAILFASVVQRLVPAGRSLDAPSAAAVADAARRLDLLRAPVEGSAPDWDAYLRGVETTRNSIRASAMPPAEKEKALLEFDAAYDAGRAPVAPRAALAKLFALGPSWLGQKSLDGAFGYDQDTHNVYDLAIRQTGLQFLDRAALSDPAFRGLAGSLRAERLRQAAERPAAPAGEPDHAVLLAALGGENLARVEAFLAKASGSGPPATSLNIYLDAYYLENARAVLASLPEGDPRRAGIEEALAARGGALADGLTRLAALPYEERASNSAGSRDQTHARMTGLLALPPDLVPAGLLTQTRDWLDQNGPLGAPYYSFGKQRPNEDLARSGAGRNVLMNLFALRGADSPQERTVRTTGLETALENFARHEAVLRATMHRSMPGVGHHFYEDVGASGADALAPYYYPSAIPRVIEAYSQLLSDPAVRADPKRLARVEAGYRTVRDGLLREFDAETGLREPLRRDMPWFYTLLGSGVAEVAILDQRGNGS